MQGLFSQRSFDQLRTFELYFSSCNSVQCQILGAINQMQNLRINLGASMKKILIALCVFLQVFTIDPLHAAERDFFDVAGNGTPEELQEWIAGGVDVNMRTGTKMTPLMDAAWEKNDLRVVHALIREGADVNAADTSDTTALMYAQAQAMIFYRPKHDNFAELTRILMDAGANINAKSKPHFFLPYPDLTVLMWATIYNRVDVVKLLIDRGARIHAKNSQNRTAYDFAVRLRFGAAADILFFENNTLKYNFALLFYRCLMVLPFLFCFVYLYRHYTLHFPVDRGTFFVSLSLGIFWIVLMEGAFGIQTRSFGAVPLIKKVWLLFIADSVILWRWVWTRNPEAESLRWSPFSFEGKLISSFLFTCFILALVWIVDPWVDHYPDKRLLCYVVPWLIGVIAVYTEFGHKMRKH